MCHCYVGRGAFLWLCQERLRNPWFLIGAESSWNKLQLRHELPENGHVHQDIFLAGDNSVLDSKGYPNSRKQNGFSSRFMQLILPSHFGSPARPAPPARLGQKVNKAAVAARKPLSMNNGPFLWLNRHEESPVTTISDLWYRPSLSGQWLGLRYKATRPSIKGKMLVLKLATIENWNIKQWGKLRKLTDESAFRGI